MLPQAASSTDNVSVVHTIPNRLRVRVVGLYGSESIRTAVEDALAITPGVRRVTASTLTATVLIVYDSGVNVSAVVATLERIVQNPRPVPPPTRATHRSRAATRRTHWWRSFAGRDEVVRPAVSPDARAWHAMAEEDVARVLDSDTRNGLSEAAAAERLRIWGRNSIPRPPVRSIATLLADQFKSLPVVLLCASAVLSVATGGLADALTIVLVVLGNATAGVVMERRAERVITGMLELPEPAATAVREGILQQVASEDIVPGDVLFLTRECLVPADCRLILASGLSVDESMLTGESSPVDKTSVESMPEDTLLADRLNMIYRGTVITGGHGMAIVTAVGAHTEAGRLQAMAFGADRPQTPIEKQLRRLGNEVVVTAAVVSGGVLVVGLLRGYPVLEMLKTAVALAVAAVPEGLPAVATTALASGVGALKRSGVVVRRLRAMEALGTVGVVCLDKTGTLTRNEMTVMDVIAGRRHYRLDDGMFVDAVVDHKDDDGLSQILRVLALCTETALGNGNSVNGSATERALLAAAEAGGVDVEEVRRQYPAVEIRHRTELRNALLTLHRTPTAASLVAIKGNPSEVADMCSRRWVDGGPQPLTIVERGLIGGDNDRLGGEGKRVLGVAFLDASDARLDNVHDAVWLGLVAMVDPVRTRAPEVVRDLRAAGVLPVMVTGDQPTTAGAIAQQLNLHTNGSVHITVPTEKNGVSADAVVGTHSDDMHAFARVSPAQKLHIVRAYQAAGRVVAMTGDGVNDSPALRAADIGLVMGQSGTRIARDVADVVLLNDHVEGMLVAIAEGRRVHSNVRKAVHYIIASNFSELIVMFGGIALGVGQPLNARQLLWVNLLTDVLPELALALEPADRDIMQRQPLDPHAPVITSQEYGRLRLHSLAMAVPVLAAYVAATAARRAKGSGTGVAFTALTAAQLVHAMDARARSDSNGHPSRSLVPHAVLAGFGVLGGGIFIPAVRALLGIGRTGAADLVLAFGAAAVSGIANHLLGGKHGNLR